MSKTVILTGLRANNDLHIGSYFGAILPLVEMAKERSSEFQLNIFVPDLHSFTTPIDHSQLRANIFHNLELFVASGLPLDQPDVHLYRQSYIPAHAELTWILNCFTGFGELSRMTEYKDKSARLGVDHIGVGQFDYPVLMAADILLYDAKYIPVGEDQRQHIEFTRDIAERMNNRFGEIFVVPEPVKKQQEFFGQAQSLRIKDLQDPTKKMSKSEASEKGIIFLGDSPVLARQKIMTAATDSLGQIRFDPENQPGISNLLQIYALLKNSTVNAVIVEFEGHSQYGEFKQKLADTMAEFLEKFQTKLKHVDQTVIESKLLVSEQKMNVVANQTLLKVQRAVGLR